MKIEAVEFFYLSMPEVLDIGDGSQDLLLVRIIDSAGNVGWGECEAAPLVSIASLVCPKSHSACKAVADSVVGQRIDAVSDISRIAELVHRNSMDVLQADHTLSGIDIALWDLLGRRLNEPVYKLLGYPRSYAKTPYASLLFGDTPQQTLDEARKLRAEGFVAIKFGWGPFGKTTPAADYDQLAAAREGLGPDGILLVDAGTVWSGNFEAAKSRLDAVKQFRATWLEEPFLSAELDEYRKLASLSGDVKIAGGEGCHNIHMARHMIDHAGIGYVQIDAGRIGGITPAKQVADYAQAKGITFVNHSFQSHLALAASMQPFAGIERDTICEYPVRLKALAWEATCEHLLPDRNGQIQYPQVAGVGITPDVTALKKYLLDVEIKVQGKMLYRTPKL